ncbi:hypothetical protein NXW50_10520 [Bacteroides thetaiotaomicron]|nr:hypothetical protein [Bacteroides thetaiotaomicron]MCS2278614.1 hypothetical protein [Bacteroides thetaiotaomicron]
MNHEETPSLLSSCHPLYGAGEVTPSAGNEKRPLHHKWPTDFTAGQTVRCRLCLLAGCIHLYREGRPVDVWR